MGFILLWRRRFLTNEAWRDDFLERYTLMALSGKQILADAQGYRDDMTGMFLGMPAITSREKCGDAGVQEVWTGTVMVILMKEPRRRR